MSDLIITYLPWLLSAITIWMTVLAGNKHPNAWAIGLANQALWLGWIVTARAWGLIPMNIALWIVYSRNHLKWRPRKRSRKPILSLDFDGVIHSYASGWKGARNIPDPPVEGVFAFVAEMLANGWDVVIHSSRARHFGGIWAMRRWLKEHSGSMWYGSLVAGDGMECVRFVRWKPPAVVTIDDRALKFDGTWPALDALRTFKPWNKR